MTGNQKTLADMRNAFRETVRRCHSPSHRQYHLYGGRGIRVCEEWRNSFDNFLKDVGLRPPGLTLERVNNDLGYSKENCKWATRAEQGANTRAVRNITWRGRTQNISQWAKELGMERKTLHYRLSLYDLESAFTKPVKCGGLLPGRQYPTRRKPRMDHLPRGLGHPLTSLNKAQVAACRAEWGAGSTFSAMARKLGVTVSTVSRACQGQGAYRQVH